MRSLTLYYYDCVRDTALAGRLRVFHATMIVNTVAFPRNRTILFRQPRPGSLHSRQDNERVFREQMCTN